MGQEQGKKVALVTGGARRIGRAIVEDLAAHGWAVAVHAHGSRSAAEALVADIATRGQTAHAVYGDLRDATCFAGLVEATQAALGPLTLLVNNASIFEQDEIGSLDQRLFDAHFALHLRAPCFLAEAMVARLPDGVDGNVVNIIDQRVWKLTPRFFSYTLSKSALWTATQTMAQALAPRVRVNAIGPGPAMASSRQQAADFRAQCAALPLGRGPSLDEFGRTIRFLVETPSITGQMIAIDGGQHLAWQTPDVVGQPE